MNLKLFFLLFFTVFSVSFSDNKLRCGYNSEHFNCRLSSKTPYRLIANYNDSEIKFPGCKAKKIWLLIRHGTRYPREKIIAALTRLEEFRDEILKSCEDKKCQLTEEQQTNLANWRFSIGQNEPTALADEGGVEIRGLAERFQARFPDLMPEKYDNRTYKFKSTDKLPTKESAGNFTIGLFGKNGSSDVEYPPVEAKDRILSFYKVCDEWQRDVDYNRKSYIEVEKFKSSPVVIETLKNLSNRLGVTVDFDILASIQETCSFETAWNENSKSPWCELLSPDEFLIMEFHYDLKYYWIDGPGHPLTYQYACTAIGNVFKFLDSDHELKVSAYFGHSASILKFVSLLGIARDPNPLLHNSYNSSKDRLWRVSLINPFATNLAFISYDCQSPEPIKSSKKSVAEENDKTPSILVMYQERIVNLPGCPKNFPCPLAVMRDKYPDEEDECQFEKMCEL